MIATSAFCATYLTLVTFPLSSGGLALTPGTRLGVYEVTVQIGEGGMGQVYRATDTRLKRQVATIAAPIKMNARLDVQEPR